METKELLLTGFKITDDEKFIQSLFPIPNIVQEQLQELHNLAQKGKKSSLKKFLKLVEKYPKIPTLKNYLSVLYQKMGNPEKANEVNHWIIAEHPNYLYGKINLAAEYWYNKEHEKMPEILGEAMDLKTLFPERDTFHVDEIVAFFSMTVIYFAEIGEIEQAELRLEIMKDVYPESPKIKIVEETLFKARLKAASKRMAKMQEDNIYIDINPTESGDKTEMPQFNHPEITQLYTNDFNINENIITEILKLPRKTVIADLEKILTDCIERYDYFVDNDGFSEYDNAFVVHAIMILGELKATESLNAILNFLKQDEDFLDFYLGDILTEYVWQALYKIENKNLDEYLKFIQQPGIYAYSKSLITEVVSQIYLHNSEKKTEIIKWFKTIITFFLNSKIEDNVIDSIFLGLLVNDIADIKADELLPDIEKLYKKGIVDIFMLGDFEEVKNIFQKEDNLPEKRKTLSIFEIYNNINKWGENSNPTFNDNHDEDYTDYEELPNSIKTIEPKIGRNDSCPCGSGKKYKKCCMNK